MDNSAYAIRAFEAIISLHDAKYPDDPMDGDETEDICTTVLKMLDGYYANI